MNIDRILKIFYHSARGQSKTQPSQEFTILVPVYAETTALAFSKFYFDALGAKVLYVLDSKKASRLSEVENLVRQSVPTYENPGSYLEFGYDKLVAKAPTDWILRIDCDEVPTPEMLSFCNDFIRHGRRGIGMFDRRQLRWHENTLQEMDWADYHEVQSRFFNRSRVKFDHTLHTPGIKVPILGRIKAPVLAKILHLDFVFNSHSDRVNKSARYELAGQVKSVSNYYRAHPDTHNWCIAKNERLEAVYRRWLNQVQAVESRVTKSI